MSFDAHRNFAYSTVFAPPAPAGSGLTLTVAAGAGDEFPSAPFNATVWPANTQPSSANAEIIRVTAVAGDVFTIARSQESSSARAIAAGDQVAATITVKTITDVESAVSTVTAGLAGETSARTAADSAEATARSAAITTAVNNLVNAAPGALDTLKELADALGDDASFATTMTNALAAKSPLPDGTTLEVATGVLRAKAGGIGTAQLDVDRMRALVPTAVKTANYSAAAQDLVLVDTTSGAVTVTLPTAPADRTTIAVKAIAPSPLVNPVTVAAGGSDVFNKSGGATSETLSLTNQGLLIQYKASGGLWYVISDDLALSQLDTRYGTSSLSVVAASGASQALALTAPGEKTFDVTLTANCTFTLSGATAGVPTVVNLVLRQDGTGGRTVTWPGSIIWLSGYVPVLHAGAAAIDVVTLFSLDGGTTWIGVQGSGTPPVSAGAILARTVYAPGVNVQLNVTATTPTALDTTNLKVVFTTQPSGPGSTEVLLELQALVSAPNLLEFYLTGTGAPSEGITIGNGISSNHIVRVTFLVTGLTPSTTYTWNWAAATNTGTQLVLFGNPGVLSGAACQGLMIVKAGLS